jgi:hypothetical protein
MRIIRTLALLGAITLLTACESMPTTSFDPAQRATVKKVGLAPVGLPEKAEVRIIAPVGANFGLIGALVEEGRAAAARTELEEVLTKAEYDFKTAIPAYLVQAMTAAGFETTSLAGNRKKEERGKFMKAVPKDASVDAVLDVYVFSFGFFAAGATTDYRPGAHIMARLVDAKTNKVLFQDQIMYGALMPTYQKAIVIPADPSVVFKDRPGLQADPTVTRAALEKALQAVAAELGKQFPGP